MLLAGRQAFKVAWYEKLLTRKFPELRYVYNCLFFYVNCYTTVCECAPLLRTPLFEYAQYFSSFMNKHECCISIFPVVQSVHIVRSMVRAYPWLLEQIDGYRLAHRFSSMPSELQPHCLAIQPTDMLKRQRSARVFDNGSERKSFCMGVVTKTYRFNGQPHLLQL